MFTPPIGRTPKTQPALSRPQAAPVFRKTQPDLVCSPWPTSSARKSMTSLISSDPATGPNSHPPRLSNAPDSGDHPCRMAPSPLRQSGNRAAGRPDGRGSRSPPDCHRPRPLRCAAHLPPFSKGTPPAPDRKPSPRRSHHQTGDGNGHPLEKGPRTTRAPARRKPRTKRKCGSRAIVRDSGNAFCKTNPIRVNEIGLCPPQRPLPVQVRSEIQAMLRQKRASGTHEAGSIVSKNEYSGLRTP